MRDALFDLGWRSAIDDRQATHSSRNFASSTIEPKPVQHPRPPLLLAAYTPSTIDRVSRRADGWMPAGFAIEAFALMFAAISGLAAGYGRDPDTLQVVVRANLQSRHRSLEGSEPGDTRGPTRCRSPRNRLDALRRARLATHRTRSTSRPHRDALLRRRGAPSPFISRQRTRRRLHRTLLQTVLLRWTSMTSPSSPAAPKASPRHWPTPPIAHHGCSAMPTRTHRGGTGLDSVLRIDDPPINEPAKRVLRSALEQLQTRPALDS
jgi:hypothetical protein